MHPAPQLALRVAAKGLARRSPSSFIERALYACMNSDGSVQYGAIFAGVTIHYPCFFADYRYSFSRSALSNLEIRLHRCGVKLELTSKMNSNTEPTENGIVYIVDDSADIRLAVGALLESEKLDYRSFASAEEFLHEMDTCPRGVAVVDLHLPGRDGHELLARLAKRRPDIRTIMMTGDGEIQAAIMALRNGAVDFVEKPLDEAELVEIIRREMVSIRSTTSIEQRRFDAQKALASLSRRERQVVDRLALGQANKQIAFDLDLSVRTVEMYRKRGMERLGVQSFAELVQLTVLAEGMVD